MKQHADTHLSHFYLFHVFTTFTHRGAETPSRVKMTLGADGPLPTRTTVSPLMTDLTRAVPFGGKSTGAELFIKDMIVVTIVEATRRG